MTDPIPRAVRPIDVLHDQLMDQAAADHRKRTAAAAERRDERDRLRAVVARIRQMTDHWEQQLPEVVRTPAVVSAIRAALEGAGAPAVVPAAAPSTDQATPSRRAGLRDELRRAVCEAEGFAWDSDMLEPDEYGDHADMVLAALIGSDTDLRQAVDQRDYWHQEAMHATARIIELEGQAKELRRLAAEAPATNTQADEAPSPDIDPVYDPRAWETYRRDAGCGCTAPAPVDCKVPHGTGAWLCVCHRLSGPLPASDPGKPLALLGGSISKHFLEPNRCLSTDGIFRCSRPTGHAGGHRTGRTFWGRRPEDDQRTEPAVVEPAEAADETKCGPVPDQCGDETGEPCVNHERQQAHAEGEHCLCGPECTEGA